MLAQELLVDFLVFGVGLVQFRLGHSSCRKALFQYCLEDVIWRCDNGSEQHELQYLCEVHGEQTLRRLSALSVRVKIVREIMPGLCTQ